MLTIITREEAVAKAVKFCKESSTPNILPDNSNMHNGICGLSMFTTKDGSSGVTSVYFPMVPGQTLESYSIKRAQYTDDFYSLIRNKDIKLFCFHDHTLLQFIVVNTKDKSCIEIPAIFVESDDETAAILKSLHDDLFSYYADIFKEIGIAVGVVKKL